VAAVQYTFTHKHPVAAVQYTFTHKQHTEYRERNTHNNQKKRKIFVKFRPCPVFASYTLAFALQLRKRHGKTSVRVVEKCPDIPVAVVQYSFTHKQYKEQHNETEYTERNILYIYIINPVTCFCPIWRVIFMLIFEKLECTVDKAYNLQDLVFQKLVKIIVVCYMIDIYGCETWSLT
jgi:hypothetical protein